MVMVICCNDQIKSHWMNQMNLEMNETMNSGMWFFYEYTVCVLPFWRLMSTMRGSASSR